MRPSPLSQIPTITRWSAARTTSSVAVTSSRPPARTSTRSSRTRTRPSCGVRKSQPLNSEPALVPLRDGDAAGPRAPMVSAVSMNALSRANTAA